VSAAARSPENAPSVSLAADRSPKGGASDSASTRMFFGGGWLEAPVVEASDVESLAGPALIVRPDTQIAGVARLGRRGRAPMG
jgi:hypothetical protein